LLERHRPPAWTLTLVLVLLVGACGGASTASGTRTNPKRYVSVVCGAVLDWKGSLEVRASNLVSDVSSGQSAAAKAVLAAYFDGLLRDTDAMIGQIQAVGAPAMANGLDLRTKILQVLKTMRPALAQAESKEEALSVNGPAPLVGLIEQSAKSTVSGVTSLINNAGRPDLSVPAASDSDCQKLFGRVNPVGLGA